MIPYIYLIFSDYSPCLLTRNCGQTPPVRHRRDWAGQDCIRLLRWSRLDGAQDSAPCTHVTEAPGACAAMAGPGLLPTHSQSDIGSSHWNINQNSGKCLHFIMVNNYARPVFPSPCICQNLVFRVSFRWNSLFRTEQGWPGNMLCIFLEQPTDRASMQIASRSSRYLQLLTLNIWVATRDVTLCGCVQGSWSEHYITRDWDNKHLRTMTCQIRGPWHWALNM